MKQNFESFRDEKPVNDNDLIKATVLNQTKQKAKEKRVLPKLPKRKVKLDKFQSFYLIHLLLLPVFLLVGLLTQQFGLLFAIVPYALLVVILYRMGGGLSLKGMDYVLWNLSVLVSTFTNAKSPNLRKYRKELEWAGAVILILASLSMPWFMVFGLTLFFTSMVFAFAEKDGEGIASMSRIVSIGLLVAGVIGLFLSPGLALATLTLSLLVHLSFEMWDGYEFNLE